jgi:Fe-S-cluster-containing hydrogenase component 2
MACTVEPQCNACGACIAQCPVGAIVETTTGARIEPFICTECVAYADLPVCMDVCPCEAIVYAPVVDSQREMASVRP